MLMARGLKNRPHNKQSSGEHRLAAFKKRQSTSTNLHFFKSVLIVIEKMMIPKKEKLFVWNNNDHFVYNLAVITD